VNVLIVEDDPVTRRILASQVSGLGHSVDVAAGGEEAWELLGGVRYPLLICDWMLPGMTGLELCRRIRARDTESYTYIILLTSLSGKERYLEAMEAGVDDFITKPPDIEQLGARIRVGERILGLERQVRNLEGLLPICSYCKRIRGESDRWEPIERYLSQRTESRLSHGICPTCYELHVRPQLDTP
jgi:DNA-binding response OmpR family regulator